MFAFLGKMVLMALAEETVKSVIKDVVKKKVTSKTDNTFDDKLVDVVFDSDSKEELARNVMYYGADTLVDKIKDDGIKDDDVEYILNKSAKSKHNGMNKIFATGITKSMRRNEHKAY